MTWSSKEYQEYLEKNIKESDLQAQCVTWFRSKYSDKKRLLFAIPNGAHLKSGSKTWRRLKREGALPGVADLFLAVPSSDAPGLFIEMKTMRKGSKQTEDQKLFEEAVTSKGYYYFVVRTHREFQALIEKYLNGA